MTKRYKTINDLLGLVLSATTLTIGVTVPTLSIVESVAFVVAGGLGLAFFAIEGT